MMMMMMMMMTMMMKFEQPSSLNGLRVWLRQPETQNGSHMQIYAYVTPQPPIHMDILYEHTLCQSLSLSLSHSLSILQRSAASAKDQSQLGLQVPVLNHI